MQVKEVGNAALGALRAPSHADIHRTIQTTQWSLGQRAHHARSMQQLQRRAMHFATHQRVNAQAQARAQRPPPVQAPRQAARNNSVAPKAHTQTRRIAPSQAPVHANVLAARQRNMRREQGRIQRQAFRQQAGAKVQHLTRATGRVAMRPAQAMSAALNSQRNRVQQAIRQRVMQPQNRQAQRPQQQQRKETQRGQSRSR